MMDVRTPDHLSRANGLRKSNLSRDSWVGAAKEVFIQGGITALGVRALASSLGVTPGAFYWQFRSLEDLHEELRQDWATRNTAPFTNAISQAGPDGMDQYLAWVRVLVEEREFRPDYDNVMRDWARGSARTAEVLQNTDLARIDQLLGVFRALGYDEKSAEIRARVAYFHQVGYIAMRIREPLETRLQNIPFYADVLTGQCARDRVAGAAWVQTLQNS